MVEKMILLMAPPQNGGQANPFMSLLPLLLIIVIFYFFMIRPQIKRNKELKKFRDNLKKGDKVVTIGGIHGKIVDVEENTFLLEIDNNVKIRIEKSAIAMDASSQLSAGNK